MTIITSLRESRTRLGSVPGPASPADQRRCAVMPVFFIILGGINPLIAHPDAVDVNERRMETAHVSWVNEEAKEEWTINGRNGRVAVFYRVKTRPSFCTKAIGITCFANTPMFLVMAGAPTSSVRLPSPRSQQCSAPITTLITTPITGNIRRDSMQRQVYAQQKHGVWSRLSSVLPPFPACPIGVAAITHKG
ncbi:hypothetical protein E2C01_000251 [Portunus trituberculatus]|uniref:Uncharacterized protein n=1 Tax=Portunus trituberculatus TaxID=210409 RepID=A0A5B7CGR8_PORTR|nr:hypothetical protein [Portunus trituberculatus]